MDPVRFVQAAHDDHLQGILDLQRRNVEEALDPDEVRRDGFVTLRHDLPLLREMNAYEPHVVAIAGERVVGYTLVMGRQFEQRLPLIAPMFEELRHLQLDGRPIDAHRFFVMGQVCVDREHRGRGVFESLYRHMRVCYGTRYDFTVTEVARRNGRSLRAHEKVGFGLWHRYTDVRGEDWDVIGWDWRDIPDGIAPVVRRR